MTHFVDFLLGVRQQTREVLQRATVEYDLRLIVCARHDVTHRSQRRRLLVDNKQQQDYTSLSSSACNDQMHLII